MEPTSWLAGKYAATSLLENKSPAARRGIRGGMHTINKGSLFTTVSTAGTTAGTTAGSIVGTTTTT